MDDLRPFVADDEAEALYRALLDRFGLAHVSCAACARVLLPPPLNWESYTYTAGDGRTRTWDVAFARAVTTRRASRSGPVALHTDQLASFLEQHGHIHEEHLNHIPPERRHEPVLVAPAPDRQGHVLVDGSHRATALIRARDSVHGFVLTPIESALAIDMVPLAMRRIHQALRERRLLPDDLRA
jgi:hypothetical protein